MSQIAFNEQFYLSQNPDVFQAVVRGQTTAQAHYNNFGRFEGRNPSQFFSTNEYLTRYSDVRNAGVNPLDHFINFGAREGRLPNSNLDTTVDSNNNDIANEFNGAAYLAANQDLVNAGFTTTTAYTHYVLFGQFEGRFGYLTGANNTVTPFSGPFANGGNGGGQPVANPGATTALTTGIDVLTGTANNDTFVGTFTGTATSTSNFGDSINGGAGVDTVRIISNADATVVPSLTAVENLIIVDNIHESRDVSGIAGLTSFTLEEGLTIAAGTITTTLGAGQTLGLTNIKDGDAAADGADKGGITVATAAGVTSLGLALNGVGAANATGATASDLDLTFSGTGLATLNVTAAGSNFIELAGGALRTVNVTGAGTTSITAVPTTLTSISAAGAAGGVTANIAGVAAGFTFTGGNGADTVLLANDQLQTLTAGTQLVGGSGIDKIGLLDTALTAAEAAKLNAATGFEVIGLNGAGLALDASTVSNFKSFSVDTAGLTTSISNLQTGSSVAVTASTASLTLAPAVGTSSVDVSLTGGVAVTSLVTSGLTTVNLTSSGTTANSAAFTNTDNSTIKVLGAQDLTLTISGTNSGSTVDGASATGKLNITGSGQGDVIRGGSADDIITGGAGADTLTGNGGKDQFVFATTDVDTTAGVVTDTITDFLTKVDTIKGNFGAGSATSYLEATAAVADLGTLLTAADGALNGTVKYYVGQVGSDSYLVTDSNGTGYTDVIKLTGVALTGIEAADVTA